MTKIVSFLLCVAVMLGGTAARADVLVLVHGYLGSAASWEVGGINEVLAANGWQRAGVVAGGRFLPVPDSGRTKRVYSVELPSLAPLLVQADHLQGMLRQIAGLNPGHSLVIAAHSAGGVVARVLLVRGGVPNAKALITIASPHLGTLRAVQALDASDTPWPLCLVQNFFSNGAYRVVKESRGC